MPSRMATRAALAIIPALAASFTAPHLQITVPSNDDVVLPPVGPPGAAAQKLLVLVPGANVATSYYKATAMAIQNQTRGIIDLWVVVPIVPLKTCIALCPSSSACLPLHERVQATIAKASAQGYNGSVAGDVIMGGHSLGGVCAGNLAQGYSGTPQSYSSLVLLGSYVQGFDVARFPMPVLTLGGELDGGLARPGVTAKSLASSDAAATKHEATWQLKNVPVVVLPGADHSSFCPGFRVPGDVWPADVDFAAGSQLTGDAVGSFLTLQMGDAAPAAAATSSRQLLTKMLEWTRQLLKPLQAAMALEGQPIPGATPPVIGAAPWCATAQKVVAGLDDAELAVTAQLVATDNFEHSRVHYATVDGTVELNVTGDAVYYGSGVTDVANSCIAPAKQIGCKLASGARVAVLLNKTAPVPARTCADVNAEAVQEAERLLATTEAGQQTLARHTARGRPLCLGADHSTIGNIGPLFVHGSMTYSDNKTCLEAASLALGPVPLDSSLFPGVQYCYLLSPARVIDYYMIDSLKNTSGCLNTGPGGPVPAPPPPPPTPLSLPTHAVTTAAAAPLVAEALCCKVCQAPEVKYFSVDVPHGFCGETCLKPSLFPIFKVFEANLTLYNGTGPSPCAEQFTPWDTHYTIYNATVTHGVWPLTCTLDLYAPEPKPRLLHERSLLLRSTFDPV